VKELEGAGDGVCLPIGDLGDPLCDGRDERDEQRAAHTTGPERCDEPESADDRVESAVSSEVRDGYELSRTMPRFCAWSLVRVGWGMCGM